MDGTSPAPARVRRWRARAHAGEGATTFELFFDLVYVFAVTQVADLMTHDHGAQGVLHGLILLGMLWWTWCGFTWLGNQVRADAGIGMAGFGLATVGVFVVAMTVPEAWSDADGGLYGPAVLVSAYLFVRVVHLVAYSIAAQGDVGLRRQIAISWLPLIVMGVLLLLGAAMGGELRTILFAVAVLGEWLSIYLTSRSGSWRIHSASHWTERYELFVLIVLGESLVAVGVGAAEHALSGPLLIAAGLGVGFAVCLWWLYFDLVAPATEQRVAELAGSKRVRVALEAYVYGHFPLIAGVVVAAVGVEGALHLAEKPEPVGAFYGLCPTGGVMLHMVGHLIFDRRVLRARNIARISTLLVLTVLSPVIVLFPALAALACVTFVLAALVVFERVHFAGLRQQYRNG
ncbi:low temperature requirement protein A [Micromonospora sp. NPDC007271]|uniref:low temperature requirement protein A n=1 Tax=Micromonospora sp. NPDC007271 TaxID=3154587 RepID=UPI0033F97BFB